MAKLNEQNLKKLEQLLGIIDEGVKKEDFVRAFKQVLDIVVKIENRNKESISILEQTYVSLLNKLSNDNSTNLSEIKSKVIELIEGIISKHDSRIIFKLNEELSYLNKKIDSKIIPTKEDVAEYTIKNIPKVNLNNDEVIEQLRKEIKGLENLILTSNSNKSRGGFRKLIWIPETPTGTINGSNTEFYLSTTANPDNLLLVLNGMAQRNGTSYEYVLSGNNKKITYNTAPPSGSQHFAWYSKP